jgi:FtsH-binding integral membrane protein
VNNSSSMISPSRWHHSILLLRYFLSHIFRSFQYPQVIFKILCVISNILRIKLNFKIKIVMNLKLTLWLAIVIKFILRKLNFNSIIKPLFLSLSTSKYVYPIQDIVNVNNTYELWGL